MRPEIQEWLNDAQKIIFELSVGEEFTMSSLFGEKWQKAGKDIGEIGKQFKKYVLKKTIVGVEYLGGKPAKYKRVTVKYF